MTSAQDTLLFFYYGGMVYTGVKMFDEAIEFYATVCYPARSAACASKVRLTASVFPAPLATVHLRARQSAQRHCRRGGQEVHSRVAYPSGHGAYAIWATLLPTHPDACDGLVLAPQDAKYPGSTSPAVSNALAHYVTPYRQLAVYYRALNAARTQSAMEAGKRTFISVSRGRACVLKSPRAPLIAPCTAACTTGQQLRAREASDDLAAAAQDPKADRHVHHVVSGQHRVSCRAEERGGS